MTMHICYDHKCPECDCNYIPFDEVPCPKCGFVEDDRDNSAIDSIAAAAKYHKESLWGMGKYTPIAWATLDFGDHIGLHVFWILDALENSDKPDSVREIVDSFIRCTDDDKWYLEHLIQVAEKVRERLRQI